jgi:hypothetical protein
MPTPHHVIVIHGMGEHRHSAGYSKPLQERIAKAMGPTAAQIHYHEVTWSDIGYAEEEELLEKNILPEEWSSFNFGHLGDSILEKVDQWRGISNQFRRFLIRSIGDVFTYLTLPGKRDIQERLKQQIFAARDAQIAAGVPAPHYVSVLAHSLGSVVIYDLARYFGDTPEGRQEIGTGKLANLITFGSPLALFSLLEYGQNRAGAPIDQQTILSDGQSDQHQPHPYSGRGIVLDLPEGAWLNFYDQQDAIACTLHDLYVPQNNVQDIPVQTGVQQAHTAYWENNQMAEAIAKQFQKTLAAPTRR